MKISFSKNIFTVATTLRCCVVFSTVAIILVFLQKILKMKQFIFGDDFQLLDIFCDGRIAFPLWKIVRIRMAEGRFYPLFFQNYNILSLFSSDLTLNNLAERCFYVQAGMWLLTCSAFIALLICIARQEKKQIHPGLYLFIPLALLTMLFTRAFVSYFMMLILAETLLCVFFPLFFLFYYLAYKKDNGMCYIAAWFFATLSIYCKENVFTVFAVICGVQFLFGRKSLTRKHTFYLCGLLASIIIYFLLYYFIIYHNILCPYNDGRLWGKSMLLHVIEIFENYPVWIFAFLLGVFRLIRLLFCGERKHLFMDSILFAALGFFISYLILKLTDWWYWGIGIILLMPVFFYWLIVYKKIWSRIGIFLILLLCFSVNFRSSIKYINDLIHTQAQHRHFLEEIDGRKGGKRILFLSFNSDGYQNKLERYYHIYLRAFLEKLGTPGKWKNNVVFVNGIPETLNPEEICVICSPLPYPSDLQFRMLEKNFQSFASCNIYEAFACNAELDMMYLSSKSYCIPAKMPFCLFGCGWSNQETWGRWINGTRGDFTFEIPRKFRKKNLKLTFDLYTFVHPKKPICRFKLLTKGKVLKEMASKEFITGFSINIPPELTANASLPLTFENIDPCSPKELGIADDPRRLGVGLCSIAVEINK